MSEEKALPKILFNTHTSRAFRTTLIFHLYEIAQQYPVTLLSEELDPETEQLLRNKALFPKLDRIIQVRQFSTNQVGIFSRIRVLISKIVELKKLAKQTIKEVRPDIIFASNDVYLFELFLFRYGKNALKISLQSTLVWKAEARATLLELTNAYLRMPAFLPLALRLFAIRARKKILHFIYYWLLPLTAGALPFPGSSSVILDRGSDGMRAVDYKIVFSARDKEIQIHNGVSAAKIQILSHPLLHAKTREFFMARMASVPPKETGKRTVTISIPAESIEFKEGTLAPTYGEELFAHRTGIVRLIADTLANWQVLITIHPSSADIARYEKALPALAPNIQFDNFYKPFDEYVSMSDAVVGFPPASTTLFTASLQSPEKAILFLDLKHELTGGHYKNFPGIDYIDNETKLIQTLTSIRSGAYSKKPAEPVKEGFGSTEEMITILYR